MKWWRSTSSARATENLEVYQLYCIVKFSSESASVYILEEIHLGDKFPNHLPYSIDETIEEEKTLRVWDIDHCLDALGIRLKGWKN